MIKSVTTLCFQPFHLDDALRAAAAAGFENVELCAVKGFLEHVDPDDVSAARIKEVRSLLECHGLRATSLSGHSKLSTVEGQERHHRLLEACEGLEVAVLNTYAGEPATPDERAATLEGLSVLADEAAKRGVVVCLENDGDATPTGQSVMELIAEIGHSGIRINYDPANASYFGGADPVRDIEHTRGCLGHVHLKDHRGGKGVLDFPPLGDGDLDLGSILAALVQDGYAGPVALEIEYDGTWPSFVDCIDAARRSRIRWEQLLAGGKDGA